MSNPTSTPRGLGEYAAAAAEPAAPSAAEQDLTRAVRHLGRCRKPESIASRLRDIAAALRPQVLATLAERRAEAILTLLLWSSTRDIDEELFTDATVEMLLADEPDPTLDDVIEAGGWLLGRDPVRDRLIERLRRLSDSPPCHPGYESRRQWQRHAARLAAETDLKLLIKMHLAGHVMRRVALAARAATGRPVHQALPGSVTRDDVAALMEVIFDPHRFPHDSDIAWLVDHAHLLDGDDNGPRLRFARLTSDQRLALARTRRVDLGHLVAAAWAHDRIGPSDEERDLLRSIADADRGYVVVAALLTQRDDLDKLGVEWVTDWAARTPEIDRFADHDTWRHVSYMPPQLYVAVGRRLTGSRLIRWLSEADAAYRDRLADALGVDGLLPHLENFHSNPELCVTMPLLPSVVVAAGDAAPAWTALLVTGALSDKQPVLDAAQALLDDGFTGSFVQLRANLHGSQARFQRQIWFQDLCQKLRASYYETLR